MRARNIKPGFFKNEELAELGFFERLLFIGLWCLADREGRLEDRPKRIKMELFPCDNCDVEDGLNALESAGFIVRYVYEKYIVIEVCKFKTHQSPHGTEKDSELPDHNGMLTVNERKGNAVVSGSERLVNVNSKLENALNPDSLIPDLPNPDSLKPESKPAKPSASLSACDLVNLGVDEQVAKDFLAVRKAKKAPLTMTALDGIKREAEKAGVSLSTALATCAVRGWQSFKAEWHTGQPSQQPAQQQSGYKEYRPK